MTAITVLRPDDATAPPTRRSRSRRARELPERPVIGLVANGKPLRQELLDAPRRRARHERLGGAEVELLRKPGAGYPISREQAADMAARAHLVITGLGD